MSEVKRNLSCRTYGTTIFISLSVEKVVRDDRLTCTNSTSECMNRSYGINVMNVVPFRLVRSVLVLPGYPGDSGSEVRRLQYNIFWCLYRNYPPPTQVGFLGHVLECVPKFFFKLLQGRSGVKLKYFIHSREYQGDGLRNSGRIYLFRLTFIFQHILVSTILLSIYIFPRDICWTIIT